jgi:ribonuclease J
MSELFKNPPADVDVVMLEGTRVGRVAMHSVGDERSLEVALTRTFESSRGAVAVFTSTQNIDRLVSVYRAARHAERTLVVDLYAATIAEATGRLSIPRPGFPALRMYVPRRQRRLVKATGAFERVDRFRRYRIFLDEIRDSSAEHVLLIQGSTLRELIQANCLEGGTAVWSLWPGYLDQPRGAELLRLLDVHGVPLVRLHASGHAHVDDLQRLVAAMKGARVVPIHTSAPELFSRYFERVEVHNDGEWWDA